MTARVQDRPDDVRTAILIFKAIVEGNSITQAGEIFGCGQELARKRYQWAMRHLLTPKYLGGYAKDCWPAGQCITKAAGRVPAHVLEFRRCAEFWIAVANRKLAELDSLKEEERTEI